MAGGIGKVFKACVEQDKCPDESCEHAWHLEYWRFNKRYRKSIATLYGVVVKGRREAEKVWLPKFISEINAALDEKRMPFQDRLTRLEQHSALTGMTFETFVRDVYMDGYYECALDDPIFIKKHGTAHYTIHQLLQRFGETPLLAFNVDLVKTYKRELKAQVAIRTGEPLMAGSRNRLLGKLRQIIRWGYAHEKGYFPSVPFGIAGVRLDTKEERPRERRLHHDPDEEAMLIEAARQMNSLEHGFVGAMMELRIVAAIDTCARRGELLRAQRKDIDFDRRMIHLPRFATDHHGEEVRGTKNWESRDIPISSRLGRLLETRRHLPPLAYVFGKQDGSAFAPDSLAKPWNTLKLVAYGHSPTWAKQRDAQGKAKKGRWYDAQAQARLRAIDLHWHDLRHEGASRYGESGEFKPKELMELLGHKTLDMTMRYWQLGETALTDAVDRAHAKRDAAQVERDRQTRRRGLRAVK